MKLTKLLLMAVVALSVCFASCKPKDADIKAEIEKKISTTADMAGTTVEVKDGVAIMSGQCKDDACKANCEKEVAGVKGVKSVVNNLMVTPPPPPPAPVMVSADDMLSKSVLDATKDFPTVKAAVKDGIVTLTGDIKKDDLKRLMPALQSLKPKKIDNKLTVK